MKISKPSKKQFKVTLYVVGAIALVTLGVAGTLKYQSFINNVKREGVAEFKLTCEKFSDKDKKTTWLECDE